MIIHPLKCPSLSYAQAADMLANTVMLSPAYFILGGNQSGQVCF